MNKIIEKTDKNCIKKKINEIIEEIKRKKDIISSN